MTVTSIREHRLAALAEIKTKRYVAMSRLGNARQWGTESQRTYYSAAFCMVMVEKNILNIQLALGPYEQFDRAAEELYDAFPQLEEWEASRE